MFLLTEQKTTRNKSVFFFFLYNIFFLHRVNFQGKRVLHPLLLDHVKWAIYPSRKALQWHQKLPLMWFWGNRIKQEAVVHQLSDRKLTNHSSEQMSWWGNDNTEEKGSGEAICLCTRVIFYFSQAHHHCPPPLWRLEVKFLYTNFLDYLLS